MKTLIIAAAFAFVAFLLPVIVVHAQNPNATLTVTVAPTSSSFTPQLVNSAHGPSVSTCYAQNTTSYTYTIPNVTAGNSILGSIVWEGNGAGLYCGGPNGPASAITAINVNGTSAQIIDYDTTNVGSGPGILTWWANNVNSGTTITVTTNGGIYNEFWTTAEFSGVPAGATLDPNGHAAQYEGDVSSTLSSPNVTPSQSGELFYGVGIQYNCGNNALTPSGGWTAGGNSSFGSGAGCFPGADEYQIYNSTSSLTATFAVTSSQVHENWAGIIGIEP